MPPPAPGQLQNGVPAKPAAEPPAAPAASDNSASKMQALEAATQKPAGTEVPRVSTPADKLPVTSSTSTSRQFIVHGKVFETRSAMSTRCEEVSQEVRKVLNDKEPWVLPVVVIAELEAKIEDLRKASESAGPGAIEAEVSALGLIAAYLETTQAGRIPALSPPLSPAATARGPSVNSSACWRLPQAMSRPGRARCSWSGPAGWTGFAILACPPVGRSCTGA